MAERLGHNKHGSVKKCTGNTHNGMSQKTLKSKFSALPL